MIYELNSWIVHDSTCFQNKKKISFLPKRFFFYFCHFGIDWINPFQPMWEIHIYDRRLSSMYKERRIKELTKNGEIVQGWGPSSITVVKWEGFQAGEDKQE